MNRAKTIRYAVELIILVVAIVYYWTYWRPRHPVEYPGSWIETPGPGGRDVRSLLYNEETRELLAGITPEKNLQPIHRYSPDLITWTAPESSAPPTHTVIDMIRSGNIIYALYFALDTEPGGVIHSSDGGQTWAKMITLPENLDPRTMSIGSDGIYYLGTVEHGVYVSRDKGALWSESSQGLTNTHVQSVSADPFREGHALAGTLSGLFTTWDGGRTWERVLRGLPPDSEFALKIEANPFKKGYFYAIVKDKRGRAGLYRSRNHGKSWSAIVRGLPELVQPRTIEIDPDNPKTLYLGTVHDGVFRTDDNGAFWSAMNRGFPLVKNYIIIHDVLKVKGANGRLYAATDLHGNVWEYRFK